MMIDRRRIFYLILSFLLNCLTNGDDIIALATRICEWIGTML